MIPTFGDTTTLNDIHFISGLPRAGSTLLSALLRQNPKFRAGMTGPVGTLIEAMLRAMSMSNESSIYIEDRQRETLLRKIFETFHGELPADHVSFDTNRLWCSKLALLAKLYPKAKVICCVRDVAAIVNSIERLVMENALQPSGIFGFDSSGTVYSRADGLSGGNGMVGFAWNALRQGFFGPHAERLMLVTYETLTREPLRALSEIYRFIGQPPFEHDLKNVASRCERVRPAARYARPACGRARGESDVAEKPAAARSHPQNIKTTVSGSIAASTSTACPWSRT